MVPVADAGAEAKKEANGLSSGAPADGAASCK